MCCDAKGRHRSCSVRVGQSQRQPLVSASLPCSLDVPCTIVLSQGHWIEPAGSAEWAPLLSRWLLLSLLFEVFGTFGSKHGMGILTRKSRGACGLLRRDSVAHVCVRQHERQATAECVRTVRGGGLGARCAKRIHGQMFSLCSSDKWAVECEKAKAVWRGGEGVSDGECGG